MKLLSARFVTSATGGDAIPRDGVPHIALVGRSNVGKSSLINALAKRRDLARTSAAAGKTRLANLYRFDVDGGPGGPGRWSVYVVDLPGYGYARGGRESVADLRKIAEAYFLAGVAGLKTRPTTDVGRVFRSGDTTPDDVSRVFRSGDTTPDDVGRVFRSGDTTTDDVGRVFRPGIAGVLHLVDARHPGLDADLNAAAWLDTLGTECAVIAMKIDKLSRAERTRNLGELKRQLGTAPLPFSAASGEGLDDLWTLIARLSR